METTIVIGFTFADLEDEAVIGPVVHFQLRFSVYGAVPTVTLTANGCCAVFLADEEFGFGGVGETISSKRSIKNDGVYSRFIKEREEIAGWHLGTSC